MIVTREWIASISDSQGLTKGQRIVLKIWCPMVPCEIPDQVAAFLAGCKGYRGMSADVRAMQGLA